MVKIILLTLLYFNYNKKKEERKISLEVNKNMRKKIIKIHYGINFQIVMQCNEGARRVERELEMRKISSQIDFPKTIKPIKIISGNRYLVRSGQLIHMQNRADDVKLTFGKRFNKVPLFLFLFNDVLLVTKCKRFDSFILRCHKNII